MRLEGLLTLADVARASRISMIELMRYSFMHADRILSDRVGGEQRYSPSAVEVFQQIKNGDAQRQSQTRLQNIREEFPQGGPLYSIADVSRLTGVPTSDLIHYCGVYDDRIPFIGPARSPVFPESALKIIEGIRRQDLSDEVLPGTVLLDWISPNLWHALTHDADLLRSLDWRTFEKVLAGLLAKMEYEIELQRGTKDGGVDIFAVRRFGPFGPHRYLLQAKRSKKMIGVEPVRQLMFLHSEHRVSKSCLATTSRFTSGAWAIAGAYQWQLELRDFDKLKEWMRFALKQ